MNCRRSQIKIFPFSLKKSDVFALILGFFSITYFNVEALADKNTQWRESNCQAALSAQGYLTDNSYALSDGSYLSTIDLSKNNGTPNIGKSGIINYYTVFQFYIYKRLEKYKNLTLEQFIALKGTQEARELAKRSVFFLNTVDTLGFYEPDFLGGIRLVFAQGLHQKLPFEIDPDVKGRRRHQHSVSAVEVGSLTVDSTLGNQSGLLVRSKKLIRATMLWLLENESYEHFYVHTSKAHIRLYQRMNLEPVEDPTIIDKDNVILYFTREQLLDYFKKNPQDNEHQMHTTH